ncbi:mCG60595, isoform CRA_a, partial [Mus musculus]
PSPPPPLPLRSTPSLSATTVRDRPAAGKEERSAGGGGYSPSLQRNPRSTTRSSWSQRIQSQKQRGVS